MDKPNLYVRLNDISQGKAHYPIQVWVESDKDKIDKFVYTEGLINRNEVLKRQGCLCEGGCGNDSRCLCVAYSQVKLINEGRIKNVGDLYEGGLFANRLFECTSECSCKGNCEQKVSFELLPHKLEITKFRRKGFGVVTREFISKGTFICQLAGEVLTKAEAERAFDIDQRYNFEFKSPLGEDYIHFSIYCKNRGNISRFFNHSCFPNMFPMLFYIDQANTGWPNVGFVAARDIDEDEELTFFYGGQWLNDLTTIKRYCHCDAEYCVYPEKYRERNDVDKAIENARKKLHDLKKKRKTRKAEILSKLTR